MFARSKRRPLRSEPNSPREDAGSLEEPSLFEAELALSVIHGLTDDHMIQELDLKNPGSFIDPTGQPHISFAR